ncbi:pentatricopeptide repeat-containing protein At5g66520-like [Malania oleifera]|uniref:pentatricopeptide repeat-containing protein At5g66520-like n=1 Tax=Malania oleifera TaxID=397392 RepID=UPI0025AE7293|nr:pentatricopeptide repeat-containing protein At5g66520-like [Malania oleifera]XP_057964660.1 pentatricopeptide repeat-containing protein At5g66520-like [Malania oleifera]XP_057964661.1 pentatricopeptide repeat-containing protein At5g66520-like [Malania oleifera]XP_057964663.1 pentatricopeptide repeat-containing protein At5g66520-like [Malania oleifera]
MITFKLPGFERNMIEPLQCPSLRHSFSRLLDECKNMKELKRIHTLLIISPYLSKNDHFFLTTRLLFFCATSDSGSLSYANDVFRLVQNPNLFAYNAMIRAYASKIDGGYEPSARALLLYKQMLSNGVAPDSLTFPFLVKVCTRMAEFGTGRSIHSQVMRLGYHNDLFIQNSMICLYSTAGFLNSARYLFDGMLTRDVVSWNSIIIGCLRNGDLDSALNLFRRMQKRNIFTWNSMITGFVQAGRPKEGLEFFHEMQIINEDMIRPNKITIASALAACASLGAIEHGKWVHGYLQRSGIERDVVIETALIDMYGKCGCVEKAVEIFKKMAKKDILAWTTMISVFALHGYGNEAFDLLKEMESEGVKPNHVTFVGLLSACAHSGLVEKGRWCFDMMEPVYSIKLQVQHYACMVDILSRAGFFKEAERLIRNMPMEPDAFVWGALLGGCQRHGNVELGQKVAQYLIHLNPLNHAFYVNLCEIFAKTGRFDNVRRVRAVMKEKGIKKVIPGCSMIEVDGVVYEFSVKGSPVVILEEVVWVLNGLSNEMKIDRDMHYYELKPVEAEIW